MLEDFKLKVFVTVAQERNFTKAAKVLGISQPAVSQNISDLENTLNTKLFERNRGDVALTENGRTFIQYAEKILYWYNSAESMFALATNSKAVKINILASDDVAEFILPDILASLYAAVPGFCCEVRLSTQVNDGFVPDIEIKSSLVPPSLDSSAALLASLPVGLVASSTNPHTQGKHSPRTLFRQPQALWLPLEEKINIEVISRIVFRCPSLAAVKRLASSSHEISALVPLRYAEKELRERSLVQLALPESLFDLYVYYVPSAEFAKSKTCSFLRQYLSDFIEN